TGGRRVRDARGDVGSHRAAARPRRPAVGPATRTRPAMGWLTAPAVRRRSTRPRSTRALGPRPGPPTSGRTDHSDGPPGRPAPQMSQSIASMAWATHSTAGHQEPSNQAKIAVGQAGTRVAPDHYFTGSEEAEPPPLTCSTSRWATSRSL